MLLVCLYLFIKKIEEGYDKFKITPLVRSAQCSPFN
jgi:hypothetical protein